MAGIVGIYCADGRPAAIEELQQMAAAVQHRGPDGIACWNSGPVAFAHLQFHTTPESLHERQPLLSPDGQACLVWYGRLDNREELLDSFAALGAQPVDQTDPGLVLTAYLQWGTECVQRLVGDFALVIWDARQRRIWCARDYIGIRPFFYFWDGKTFLFGPEIRSLLAHPLVSLRINEGMAGEYLASAITSCEETLYSDIQRLPSGSTLTIDSSGALSIASWWNPDLSLLQYRSEVEYAEHFRDLMEQSVRAMTRTCVPWGVPLSGGLDSSTIAVTAQSMLSTSGSPERVQTFSLACPGKAWDESEYISETARFAGLKNQTFPAMLLGEDYFRCRTESSREFPDYPNGGPMLVPMYEAAKAHGVRVLLSGIGGNQWLDGWPMHISELAAAMVRAGGWDPAIRTANDEHRMWGGNEKLPAFLLRRLAAAAEPAHLRAIRRKTAFLRSTIFSKAFLRRTHLADRIHDPRRTMHRFSSRQQASVLTNALRAAEVHILEMNDREIAQAGLEWRHPFYYRKLAEFCLRLPRDQRQRGNTWKWILRNAMRGRLPERVRTKTFQAEFSELYEAALFQPWARHRLAEPVMGKHTDWLDSRRFAAWAQLPPEPPPQLMRPYRPLWTALAIDLWVENLLLSGSGH